MTNGQMSTLTSTFARGCGGRGGAGLLYPLGGVAGQATPNRYACSAGWLGCYTRS